MLRGHRAQGESANLCYIFSTRPRMTREDPAAFAPPPAFGPFRVLHQIGVGVLGPVFRTYEPTRDRLIAVKVFRLDVTPEQAHALADELSRAAEAGLFHPSIVEPVAAGLEGSTAYRAEEYVAAESLDVAIRHYAPAPVEKVLPFVTQLAGAIDFARAAGIGHGALHLRDVFVTPDDVRISGFGVVEALERSGLRAPVRRPYSAPERIAGGMWSTPADVFALAVICYELLTGRRPAGTGQDIGDLASGGTPDGGIAHAGILHAVLARAMDEDPSVRFQSALAFASALEAAARGEHVSGAVGQGGAVAGAATAARTDEEVEPHLDTFDERAVDDGAGVDDIAIERDEDAVFYDRAEEEAAFRDEAEAVDGAPDSSFDDIEVEAEADLVLAPPPGDSFDETDAVEDADVLEASAATHLLSADDLLDNPWKGETSGRSARGRNEPVHAQALPYDEPGVAYGGEDDEARGPDDAPPAYVPGVAPAKSDMLSRAVFLVLGLLIGFAAGYAARGGAPPADQAQADARVEEPAPPPVAGADTEQRVLPPAVAPDVPDEAPVASPRSVAAPAAGRIVVNSTPAKAAVTVNGEWRGRTPLTLDEQPFGGYDIRIVQEGYVVATERVELSASNPTRTVSVRLERSAPAAPARPAPAPPRAAPPASQKPAVYTGSLSVDSRPRGARVVVNGKAVGTTPLTLSDLPIGSHVVRLELDNYRVWSTSATVQAGQETRVSGSLDPIR
jgi:hypothetical protein